MSADPKVLASWEAFEELARRTTRYAAQPHFNYAFRGQPETYDDLRPPLTRTLTGAKLDYSQLLTVERTIENEFLARAETVGLSFPDRPLHFALAALMRHHGAPTRLLDWSASPYCALYFACSSSLDQDGELWITPTFTINDDVVLGDVPQDFFETYTPKPCVRFSRIARHNRRSAGQQGLFSVADDLRGDHYELLLEATRQFLVDKAKGWEVHSPERYIVPAAMKRPFLRDLWIRNIHAASLFPDLDGLGLYAADMANLYCFTLQASLREALELAEKTHRRDRFPPK